MILTFAWAAWAVGIVTVLFLLICVMMILTVLIQRPQGGGLSGAFGSGAGSGQTAFGAKTGDALTIFTIIVFVLFLGLAIGLNFGYRPPVDGPVAPAIQATSDSAPADKGAGGKTGAVENAPPAGANPATDTKAPTEPGGAPPQPAPPQPPPGEPAPVQPSEKPSDQPK